VKGKSAIPKCEVTIFGEIIPFLIDTGACNNIINLAAYNRIRRKVMLQPISEALYAYGSDKQLNMIGCFDIDVKC